ncbi:cobalamin-binding protein [Candidatus Poribacteria bacterium]|nr:cobalamin-binding protein [Candidatus Poribacteria bacterium]
MLSRADAMSRTEKIVDDAIKDGVRADTILNEGFLPAMTIIGDQFSEGEVYIPDVLIAAKAMQAAVDKLKPMLSGETSINRGTVVIGTVKGDLHDIGKNLVKYMLQGSGFNVIDLGNDVSPEQFAQGVRDNDAQIVAMSALLTTTMGSMKDIIDGLEEAGIRESVKTLIGGAPITQEFADKIKADGYAKDAGSAVHVAMELAGHNA